MLFSKVILAALVIASAANPQTPPVSEKTQARIARDARHEILMLPYSGVFDNIVVRVDNCNVTLSGQVTRPILKSSAENVTREIEGVDMVFNEIELLPLSANDDRLRVALYRAIYGYASLLRYSMPLIKPIRIIVKNGEVTLEGVVDTEEDKSLVSMRANGVRGVFSVTNNLHVDR
jgi:hyperosmotically inducible protein